MFIACFVSHSMVTQSKNWVRLLYKSFSNELPFCKVWKDGQFNNMAIAAFFIPNSVELRSWCQQMHDCAFANLWLANLNRKCVMYPSAIGTKCLWHMHVASTVTTLRCRVLLLCPGLQLHVDAVNLKELTHLIMVRTSGTLPWLP